MLAGVRHAGAVFTGPWAPASVGDYLAGPSHVLPTFGSARFAGGLQVADFVRTIHAITLDQEALTAVAPAVATLARAEGLDAHALSVQMRLGRTLMAAHRAATTSPTWRDTTRPRSRSTSASTPTSRPTRRRRRGGRPSWRSWRRSRSTATPTARRWPCATAIGELHGVGPDQVLVGKGSNEVLQATVPGLRRPRPHGGRLRAHLRPPLPHRPHHRHRRGRGGAGRRLHPRPGRGAAGAGRGRARDHVPQLAQQPHRAGRAPGGGGGGAGPGARAGGGRRGLRPVRAVVVDVAAGRRPARWSSPARSPRRGRWPAAAWATWWARPAVVAQLERVVLPYHLDAASQIAGRLALRFQAEMEARVAAVVAERERLLAGLRGLAVEVWPSARQLRPVPPASTSTAPPCGRAWWSGRCWCATARRGPGWPAACGSPSAPPPRTTPSCPP